MAELSKFPFSLQMYEQEAKVRGLYLTVCCDVERILSDIMAKCELDDISLREHYKSYLPFEMGAKLKMCKDVLERYNAEYYKFFTPEFEAFEELLKYRDMLAHGFTDYDDNQQDKTFIDFYWVTGTKKNRIWNKEKVIIKPFVMKMLKYREHVMQLMKLLSALSNERGHQ